MYVIIDMFILAHYVVCVLFCFVLFCNAECSFAVVLCRACLFFIVPFDMICFEWECSFCRLLCRVFSFLFMNFLFISFLVSFFTPGARPTPAPNIIIKREEEREYRLEFYKGAPAAPNIIDIILKVGEEREEGGFDKGALAPAIVTKIGYNNDIIGYGFEEEREEKFGARHTAPPLNIIDNIFEREEERFDGFFNELFDGGLKEIFDGCCD